MRKKSQPVIFLQGSPRYPHLMIRRSSLLITLLFCCAATSFAEPIITSWFTEKSGTYARIYETLDDQNAQNAVTTWSRGQGTQALPTYAGVHEISYTATDVYIRSTNLGFHIMGPWYGNEEKTNLFPNYPDNRNVLYRFPRTPTTPPVTKVPTGLGVIGYFVDGISMFDSRDAFSYNNAEGADERPNSNFDGDDVWNRDAYINESVTFDSANAHQAGSNHHYHANPPGLRHLLGDSVDFDPVTNAYTENFNGEHSPIIGWVEDGYPVYGPYGFSNPNDPTSQVTRMRSGYRPRNLANGAARDSLPQWVVALEGRSTTIPANRNGPNVSNAFPVGHYLEDYEYLGDVGQTPGVDFDLDEHNGRICVTPEFPGGTFAYFTAIEADGTPIYPYNIGRSYYGTPMGGNVGVRPAGAEIYFEGGPERPTEIKSVSADDGNGDVVLTWSAAEGGSYHVETSIDSGSWTDLPVKVEATSSVATFTDGGRADREDAALYIPRLASIAPFDDVGFDYDNNIIQAATGTITVFLNDGSGDPPPSSLTALPDSITFNGQSVNIVSRPSQYAVELEIDVNQLADDDYIVSAIFSGSSTWTGTFNHVGNPNILLLIVDDWGADSSPIDNNATQNPGTTFPTMANLEALAAGGVRFTNGYSQPVCSPTRAALLTGRQAFRTGVGAPGDPIDAAETTLPEAFAAASSPFQLASFGKWHLGGNATGYSTLGGWPHFVGITGGGVADYYDWPKNTNGTTVNNTVTYTTSDQVNEAKSFIDTQETAGNPWFVWMGFNAPHTPFHEPPANLLQGGTGANNRSLYEKALEALDSEIGRLLESVDLAKTTVILVGDNGTPGQVVQAPYGNGHAKDDLYEGGIHVPFVVRGPSVKLPAGSTSDRFVHVADLFPTILEIAGVSDPGTGVDGTSILPILEGNDSTQRTVVTELIGANSGRSIRSEAYPEFKLIIFGDPNSTSDDPTFEFYNLSNDENEQSPLSIPGLTGVALDAYNHLIGADTALGGGYSAPSTGPEDTLYLELPVTTGPTSSPQNLNATPDSITVDGVTATFVSRVDQTETAARYWVKCTVPEAATYSSATVTFPDNPNTGDTRVFNSIQIVVAP